MLMVINKKIRLKVHSPVSTSYLFWMTRFGQIFTCKLHNEKKQYTIFVAEQVLLNLHFQIYSDIFKYILI